VTFLPGTPPPIRVFICDDMGAMRQLLRDALRVEIGILVVGEAADGIGAIRGIRASRPDVAILDVRMPRADGIDVLRAIRRTVPGTRAVMLSAHGTAKLARATLDLGASHFIDKTAPISDLVAALRSPRALARDVAGAPVG
jgi:DNA-binding NarL/FixJ family response regulator